ncbi:MAG: Ig-like domain-containing protein, partial [Pirellulales bacterium]
MFGVWTGDLRRGKSRRAPSRKGHRRLTCESLEDRRVLAGDTVEILPDTITVPQDSPWTVLDVLDNDIFPDDYAGPRRISSASFGQLGGAVRLVDDGRAIEYQPPAGVAGTDSLVYIVDRQHVGQVKVRIDAPLADDLFDVVQHTPEQRFDLLANDPFFPG